jgi:hypothetical protein
MARKPGAEVSKRTRRLWFGDWQPDEEPADTIVISDDVDDAEPRPVDRRRNLQRAGLLAAIVLVGAIAFALSSGGSNRLQPEALQTQFPQQQVPPNQVPQAPPGAPPQGFGGADLTGSEAAKAARAAVSKFPGGVERVTRDSTGGGYIVHVIQAEGNEVHVLVDGQFHVRGSDSGAGPRSLGPGTSQ